MSVVEIVNVSLHLTVLCRAITILEAWLPTRREASRAADEPGGGRTAEGSGPGGTKVNT